MIALAPASAVPRLLLRRCQTTDLNNNCVVVLRAVLPVCCGFCLIHVLTVICGAHGKLLLLPNRRRERQHVTLLVPVAPSLDTHGDNTHSDTSHNALQQPSLPPQLHNLVFPARRDAAAVRAPVDRIHLVSMTGQVDHQLARPQVPHLCAGMPGTHSVGVCDVAVSVSPAAACDQRLS